MVVRARAASFSRQVRHRPPGPEACGLRYLHEYKANIFVKYFILSTKVHSWVGSWVGHFDALRLFGPLRMAQRNRVNPTRRLDQASHPSAWDAGVHRSRRTKWS